MWIYSYYSLKKNLSLGSIAKYLNKIKEITELLVVKFFISDITLN